VGIDEDPRRRAGSGRSWWRQTNLGDWEPIRGGVRRDTIWGLMEIRGIVRELRNLAEPLSIGAIHLASIARSTAMNADVAYASGAACFEGYERWLNDVERVGQYAPGDAWGCIGAGSPGAAYRCGEQYIVKVKEYLSRKVWLNAASRTLIQRRYVALGAPLN